MQLSDSIETVKGIGPKLAEAFKAKGVETIGELLLYLPRQYDDYSHIVPIKDIRPGPITIKAKVSNLKTRTLRRGMSITEAIASDATASIKVVWFNQPYRQASTKAEQLYYLSGLYKLSHSQFSLINPSIELIGETTINSARIVPIYPETKSLKSIYIRKALMQVIGCSDQLEDFIPFFIIKALELMTLPEAIKNIHYPLNADSLAKAKRRLQFNELFPLLLANSITTQARKLEHSPIVPFRVELAQSFVSMLPFQLTDDQRKVIWQIYQDMQQELPMNRLVEGDVGSGKTVVVVMAAVMAMSAGFKVAFMAPTELLAKQHLRTIMNLLVPLGMDQRLFLLTGSMKKSEKKQIIANANDTKGCFIIGTHSLLTSGIDWSDLSLLVIDEQHRFGVDQRTELQKQAGRLPHFLSTTATPIPRSLALTVLSDLNLSRLKTMPKNRIPIKTELIAPTINDVFLEKLNIELAKGRQAYIVCPYIHPNNDLAHISAEEVFDEFKRKVKNYRVAIIHGQLSSEQQTNIMQEFMTNKINVLVATTVIEVGVDVPNASIMAIYGPDRFGLAQLHQLRGRIGRGEYESTCYLLLSDNMAPSKRLRDFSILNDGFKLSELDLQRRGPGAIYGKLQHGKGSSFFTLNDNDLVKISQQAVDLFFQKKYKLLEYKVLSKLVEEAQQLIYLN